MFELPRRGLGRYVPAQRCPACVLRRLRRHRLATAARGQLVYPSGGARHDRSVQPRVHHKKLIAEAKDAAVIAAVLGADKDYLYAAEITAATGLPESSVYTCLQRLQRCGALQSDKRLVRVSAHRSVWRRYYRATPRAASVLERLRAVEP